MNTIIRLTTPDLISLLMGALNTALFSVAGVIVGLTIGVLSAAAMTSNVLSLKFLARAYVEFTRNTPLLVQVFVFFFALPSAGLKLTADQAAICALIFNFGAYSAEIVRAGIESIHKGQVEASLSLGLSNTETFRHVIIMPAVENVYPALVSQFTLLMLSSSIVSAIGANELTAAANTIQSRTFQSFPVYLTATFLYLALTFIFRACFVAIGYVIFPRRRAVRSAATEVR